MGLGVNMRTNEKNISFVRKAIRQSPLMFLCFLLLSLLISAGNQSLLYDVLKPEQSTTGPFPSLEIDLNGYVFDKVQLQAATVISEVPAYIWRHGCGPTAVGMIIGYHDAHGFPRLIEGEASFQGELVNSAIASIENYYDYCLPLDYEPWLLADKSEAPFGDEHNNNCIADYMKTSQSYYSNYYGWSWDSDIKPSFENYVSSVGKYWCAATRYSFLDFSWDSLKNEINGNRPLVFLVDTDGDDMTDHFIAVVGYNSEGGVDYFGCYNTWDMNVHWYPYRAMGNGKGWGVYSITTFNIRSTIYAPKDFNLQRLENNLVFFKEYIDRLSWAADERKGAISLKSVLFRKLKGASDATYQLIAELDGTEFSYEERGLRQLDSYTYRILFRDPQGRESDPVEVSN
jgi:hypothetical protein